MFRKTFIRLALLVIVLSVGFIVFAATKALHQAKTQSCETKTECAPEKAKGDFYILETLGRSVLNSGRN